MLTQQVGKSAIAVELLCRSLAANPDNLDARINLGIIFKNQGRLEKAITNFGKALALRPDIAILHYNLAVALRDQGRMDEAIGHYR